MDVPVRRAVAVVVVALASGLPCAAAPAGADADTERVSLDVLGGEADGHSTEPSLDGDGRFVAFSSTASDLVESDANGRRDVFLTDRATGDTVRVSVDTAGGDADGDSGAPEVSDVGRVVLFDSSATDLVQAPGTGGRDLYARDVVAGTTERVNVYPDGSAAPVRAGPLPRLSGDGRWAVFATTDSKVWLRDLVGDRTQRVVGQATEPTIDDDGDRIAFTTAARLTVQDWNSAKDVYVWDSTAGSFTMVSVRRPVPGGQRPDALTGVISGDGLTVAFVSKGRDLVADPVAVEDDQDLFVRDLAAATTFQVTVTYDGRDTRFEPDGYDVSDDGREVAFATRDRDVVPDDDDLDTDVFVRSPRTGVVVRANTDAAGGDADGSGVAPDLSDDGDVVAFSSTARDLVGDKTTDLADVFVTATDLPPPPPAELSVGSAVVAEGGNGRAAVVLPVVLSRPAAGDVTVAWSTADGTATAPQDFVAATGTVTIPVGSLSGRIAVTAQGDAVAEGDEGFEVRLSDPVGAELADAAGTVTLVDDEMPTVAVADVVAAEGSEGQPQVVVPVRLSAPAATDVTASWSTVDGSAVAGLDYVATSGPLVIEAGRVNASVVVELIGDDADGVDEHFAVVISDVHGALPADPSGRVVVRDDDPASGPTVAVGDVALPEGDAGANGFAWFPVVLSGPAAVDVTVGYATVDGTATAPEDYTAATGVVTVPAGATSASVPVRVVPDAVGEGDETFALTLTSASAGTVVDDTGIGTVVDDDRHRLASVGDVRVAEGDAGDRTAVVTVVLHRLASSTVTVEWTTAAGTAAAGDDFQPASGTVQIPRNRRSATIAVVVVGDVEPEPAESFTVVLSSPSGLALVDPVGTVTVANDD